MLQVHQDVLEDYCHAFPIDERVLFPFFVFVLPLV